ncbi:MAG: dimethylargininase [Gemmatimonadetes bacterium]|nr:dimethylargininase [Gemmatimonadota bacterium]
MIVAITREVSRSITECELTHVARTPIDLAVARDQHDAYEEALESLGVRVIRLPELPDLPDAVFVEDVALVLDEVAVLGGDVLRIGRTLYVGLTQRTTAEGIAALRALVAPFSYDVREVAVAGALHLKTAVTQVSPDWILVNPDWVDAAQFDGFDALTVDPAEPFAANAVMVSGGVIHSTAFPRTQNMLRAHGVSVIGVDASELAKAEGGVTCCSLLFDVLEASIPTA